MCAACAMTAAVGATGARSWLQAQHASWLTERRLKIATVSIFSAAVLASTVTLSGSTPPAHHAASPATQQAPSRN
jgi:hypothetical protein